MISLANTLLLVLESVTQIVGISGSLFSQLFIKKTLDADKLN